MYIVYVLEDDNCGSEHATFIMVSDDIDWI